LAATGAAFGGTTSPLGISKLALAQKIIVSAKIVAAIAKLTCFCKPGHLHSGTRNPTIVMPLIIPLASEEKPLPQTASLLLTSISRIILPFLECKLSVPLPFRDLLPVLDCRV
jgi:hypothetical protein